ncbi:MAG: hypothetical protein M3Q80_01290 [bacterium]|nr:hypothetical protein [bacterium]
MQTNNKKYWLRGGIIAIVVGLFFLTIYFLTSVYLNTEAFNWPIFPGMALGIILNYLLFKCEFLLWNNTNPDYCDITSTGTVIAATLLIYFILGVLIGWIYCKIKNKKQITCDTLK